MKHIFIINPVAGKTDSSKKLISQLETISDLDYEVMKTEYPGHAEKLVKEIAENYQELVRVYSCGGDGTLNEVMTGAYGHKHVEVGCFPYGTGNDFIKNFGDSSEFLNFENVVNGTSIDVDILETNIGIAASICSVGFDANVGYNTRHYKKLPLCHGKMAYNLSVIECLMQPIGTHLKITVDDQVFEDDYLMVCLANGTTYGGGFKSAPEASLQDGLIDVIIVNKVSRLYIAKIISKYANGTYQEDCQVQPEFEHCITYLRGRKVEIQGPKDFVINRDGECIVKRELIVEVKDKTMKFIVPKGIEYKK